jgi:pimeloyl-ACP methyl ester carboxylesterase
MSARPAMRKVLSFIAVLGANLIAVVIGAGAFLGLRAWNADPLAITAPPGIDEGRYVQIGRIDQWIQIRGQNVDNPVVLFLHGGPGATLLPYSRLFQPWEKEFTVVQWDQRGAGRTLAASGDAIAESMSIERMTEDGIEVARYLRGRLHKDRIVLLGLSWGSILGIRMIREHPELFAAYVGTGQVTDMGETAALIHRLCLERARAAGNDEAVNALEALGPPPYETWDRIIVHYKWRDALLRPESERVALTSLEQVMRTAPGFSPGDLRDWDRGFRLIPSLALYRAMDSTNLLALGTQFSVPVFFFEGMDDLDTPASLVRAYFDAITAPRKEYVPLEGGHIVLLTAPDKFLTELVTRVRPLATP